MSIEMARHALLWCAVINYLFRFGLSWWCFLTDGYMASRLDASA